MKRKFFTLLLALFALTAFQTNVQSETDKYWIRVDMSGLDSANSDTTVTSYPKKKATDTTYKWLSVIGDSVYVKFGAKGDNKGIYTDPNNRFEVSSGERGLSFTSGSATLKSFFSGGDGPFSRFEIVQFNENTDESKWKREPQNWNQQAPTDIEGYLAFQQGEPLTANSPRLTLAGIDNTGKISFKEFSEFGTYFPNYGYYPWESTILNPTEDTLTSGRLYQSTKLPLFQVYTTGSDEKSDSALVKAGGYIVDWGKTYGGGSGDSAISYYDFNLNKNGSVFLHERTVSLDSIVYYLKGKRVNIPTGIDTTSSSSETGKLYIRSEGGKLVVTSLKADNQTWTGGAPAKFSSPKLQADSLYYYINISEENSENTYDDIKDVLIYIFGYEDDYFISPFRIAERYLNKDTTSWKPLYVKVTEALAPPQYEYVNEAWLQERNYDLASVTQRLINADAGNKVIGAISGNDATAVIVDTIETDRDKRAQFGFEVADKTWGDIYSNSTDNEVTGIELFRIKNDNNNYLTVLDTTIFISTVPTTDNVANTQLGWKSKKTGTRNDLLRQLFAIIYDKKNAILSFLPVASYARKGETYNKDTVVYNKKIGYKQSYSSDDVEFFAFDSIWHITSMSVPGPNSPHYLVISEDSNKGYWFKTDLDLDSRSWKGEEFKDKIVVITRGDTAHYFPDKEWINHDSSTAVLSDSIRSHWFVKQIGKYANRGNLPIWKFTPVVDSIYDTEVKEFFADSLIVFTIAPNSDEVEFIRIKADNTVERKETTVKVTAVSGEFSLFLNIDSLLAESSRSASIKYRGSDGYISFTNKPVQGGFFADLTTGDSVLVHKSNTQYLGQRKNYAVPYYTFSTRKNDTDYFLQVQAHTDSVFWVPVGSDVRKMLENKNDWTEEYSSYKFCLPRVHGSDSVYLQTLVNSTSKEKFTLLIGDAKELSLRSGTQEVENGIYSAIEYYGKDTFPHKWTIVGKGRILPREWVRLDADTVMGALIYHDYTDTDLYFTPVNNVVVDQEEPVNYGVLVNSSINTDTKKELTLQYKGDSEIGYTNDSIWYYSIKADTLYLTDAMDFTDDKYQFSFIDKKYPYAFFSPDTIEAENEFQRFGLKRINGSNDLFAVVSNANNDSDHRYLCQVNGRLVFIENSKDFALQFTWGEAPTHTGIKAIGGTPAKIFGVAGGVKVTNATGAVSVYTIDGRLVTTVGAVSADQTIAVPAGIYVVKNGATVGKVVVR